MSDPAEKLPETDSNKESRGNPQPETGLFDRLWNFFGELKVVIVLLIVISVASILGTVILQNAHPEQYVRTYGIGIYNLVGSTFLQHLIPIDYDVDPQRYVVAFGGWAHGNLRALGLTHVYSSRWYVALLGMLGFSIFVCSANRLRMILDAGGRKVREYDPDRLLNYSNSRRVEMGGDIESGKKAVGRAAGRHRFRLRVGPADENGVSFEAERGAIRRWGAFITHASLLVIFAGALLGVYAGFEDMEIVPEGESFYVARGDFWVRVNSASVEYDRMLRPLEYTSDLSVFEGGREVARKNIEVNHPLVYKGIYFYQSSFGVESVEIRVAGRDGPAGSAYMEPGRPSFVAGGLPRLFFGSDDVFADRDNPRIFLRYLDPGGSPRGIGWLTRDEPLKFMGARFVLGDIWQYTGLQVKKDPGIPLVWVGCTLLVVGMFMMFYIRRRRVFGAVRVAEGGKVVITVAGTAGRGDEGFGESFSRFGDSLEEIAGSK